MKRQRSPRLFAPDACAADWHVTTGDAPPLLAIVAKVAFAGAPGGAVALRAAPRLSELDRTVGPQTPSAPAVGIRVLARIGAPGCERSLELAALPPVPGPSGDVVVTFAAATPAAGLVLGETTVVVGVAANGHPTVWPSGEALRRPRRHLFEDDHVRTGPILESDLAAAGLPFVRANPSLRPQAERRSPTPPSLVGLPFRPPAESAASRPTASGQPRAANDGPPSAPPARSGDTVPARSDGPFAVSTVVTCLRPPRHDLTIVVKASFDLVDDAPAAVRAEPELLSGDVYEGDDPNGKLLVASDMAPLKTSCDVLVYTAAMRGDPVETPHQVVLRVSAAGQATTSRGLIERKTRRPAELGPISPTDPRRAKLLGTYDAQWFATRWPHFAADLDPRHFQAAPEAQRLEAASGDETYEILGARPDRARVRGDLPGIRPVAVAHMRGGERRAVALRLDTVAFFVDDARVDLVWRGIVEVSDDDAPEIDDFFVTAASVRGPAPSLDEIEARFRRSERGSDAATSSAGPESDAPESAAGAEAAADDDGDSESIEDPPTEDETGFAAVAAGTPKPDLEQISASMREAGADEEAIADAMTALAPEPEPAAASGAPPHRAATGGDGAPAPADDVRSVVMRRLEAKESLAGLDLAHADLSGLDLSGQDLGGRDLTGANLEGADMRGACLEDAELCGARLKGADLRGARAACAGFHHAALGAARFDGAHLEAADFTAADLEGAVFDDAHLASVRLYDVRAAGASFRRADLAGGRAEGALVPGGCFAHALLDGSVWERADLTKASFEAASLRAVSLVRARCDGAVFVIADLTRARLSRATLLGCSMIRANLFGANLDRADLRDVDLRAANLHGTSVLRTNLLGARLDGAIVTYSLVASRAS